MSTNKTKLDFYHTFFIAVGIGLLAFAAPALATVKGLLPDFYAEPGLNPFRDQVSANVTENIDPFSGTLTLTYTDLVVPGNGGLDIKIKRTYNSNNIYHSRKTPLNIAPSLSTLLPRTPTGLGWTLHFGRVLKTGDAVAPNICDTNGTNPNDDTLDNPILELPDGRQQILFVNATSFNALFITKEQWVAYCLPDNVGLLVISPEGMKYRMNLMRSGGFTYGSTANVDYAWYPTRIEDRNGNFLTITYAALSAGKEAPVSRITASDGRVVDFTYTGNTPTTVLLNSITANGQTWQYQYTPLAGYAGGYQLLTRVVRPDGSTWNYEYWNKSAGLAGDNALNTVTYPYGGTVTYDYGYVCFMGTTCNSVNDTFNSLVIASKVNGGRDVAAGTWTYSYAPSATEDVTTVTFPGGRYEYRHFGSRMFIGGSTIPGSTLWRMGLLKEKRTFNGTALAQTETYTWAASSRISNEQYVRPPYDGSDDDHPRYADLAVFVPVLQRKDIVRDGATYTTTYSNFDASFNPRTIGETGQATRTTNLTYFPRNTNQNIVRLVEDETLAGFGNERAVFRTFDARGNPTQVTRHGVTENYSYFATGDLASRTNARGFVWSYSNYLRGIPRNEQHPEGVTVNRVVNNTGTIASETNGRGLTTSFTYDGLNRITSITRPVGTPISVAWASTSRTVTRGTYTQRTDFDGFGRPSFVDTAGVTKNVNYDALGHKSFESYFSSTTGDSFTTDVLGRVTAISHPDGTSQGYSYAANRVTVRNERNFLTTYTHRSFGDPDNATDKVLMRIDAPEGVVTTFNRDISGLPTSINQGGVTRTNTYSGINLFLMSETNPETGTTNYGRDQVGNMTSRQVGTSPATGYAYDGLNRLTAINFPGTTPDVAMGYDANNNLTVVDNGIARRTLSYDNNDNLTSEVLAVGVLSFTAAYAYTALDYLSSITYPSLRQVSYSPNVLGRPTTVLPFINSVSHHPNGVPAGLTYANGQVATFGLNNRQWISSIAAQRAGVAFAADLSYGYDGAGNVTSITNALDTSDSKSMAYDGLDRLVTAGVAALTYDPIGNITSFRTSAGDLTYAYDGALNRLTGISGRRSYSFSYDTYGNISGNGQQSFAYDDAGNLRNVGSIAAYDYDGKNMRVRTQTGGRTTHLFYSQNGNLLGEYDATGAWKKEYAYLGNKLVTTVENVPVALPSGMIVDSIAVPQTSSTGTYAIAWTLRQIVSDPNSFSFYRDQLEEATSPDFSNAVQIFQSLPGTRPTSYTLTGKSTGTYYYRIRSCASVCTPYITGANPILVDTTIASPGVPSSITVPSSSTGTYTISWGSAGGIVATYELYESTSSAFATSTLVHQGGATVLSRTLTRTAGTYYYRVRACNTAGCGNYQAGANPVVVVSIPSPPAGISLPFSVFAGVPYTISWGASAGSPTRYELYESTNSGFATSTLISSGSSLSFGIPRRTRGVYYYRVRACNSAGCSAYATGASGVRVIGLGSG